MSIVRMKRFRLIALEAERDALLQKLLHIGCAEISQPEEKLADPQWAALLRRDDTALSDVREQDNSIQNALLALDKYAPAKTGLFQKRPAVKEGAFLSRAALESALGKASEINGHMAEVGLLFGQENRLTALRASLVPWTSLDVPLALPATPNTRIAFGVCPSVVNLTQLQTELSKEAPSSQLILAHTDRDQHYLLFLCHEAEGATAEELLKQSAFSRVAFQDTHGTATESIAVIDQQLQEVIAKRTVHENAIQGYQDSRADLKLCADRMAQELSKEAAKENLLTNGTVFFAEGWIPAPEEETFASALTSFTCACETAEPAEGEKPPTLLKNSKLVGSVNSITEMYALPAYDSVDPNPLMFPFYVMFFGMMYADVAYGLILFLATHIILKKYNPKGGTGSLLKLIRVCGVTTMFWGFLSGSFFSDVIPVIADAFFGVKDLVLYPPLINPVQDPLPVLYLSLALGVIQILFGMGIRAYMLIRDGHVLDAIFDVGSWWVLFAGIAVLAVGGTWIVLVAGLAMLILTQGRKSPKLLGKLGGGIASLYDITSYLGDILSYSRLMALMLASSVIGSLVNLLGSLAGSWIVFILIFLIGHAFNMAINVIGTYVHAARLQYLEFFGKFYRDGGIPFRPLTYNTKYVDVMKEEQ